METRRMDKAVFMSLLPPGASAADLISLLFVPLIVFGIHLMRSPKTAVAGNLVGSAGVLAFILISLAGLGKLSAPVVWMWMATGSAAGVIMALRVKMIQMPELVALLNGIGGLASAIVALLALTAPQDGVSAVTKAVALTAVAAGALTFSGSVVAALKLSRLIGSRPKVFRFHSAICILLIASVCIFAAGGTVSAGAGSLFYSYGTLIAAAAFGWMFMIRVGGADMPVSISLLNAMSGVAAAIAGYAVSSPVPVAVGVLVGAAGLMLTFIMCRAMNRSLADIFTGRTTASVTGGARDSLAETVADERIAVNDEKRDPAALLASARRVVIVPGYGMALAQAQTAVRQLFDCLEKRGVQVSFAIHPVAGRMPGHMHILLAEAGIPYERFMELEQANPLFKDMDVVLVVGANDVVNPAANSVEGTPISGMPVLKVEEAKAVIICNLDRQPGYAGVPNPLYDYPRTTLCLGDAAKTVAGLVEKIAAISR